MEIAHLPHLNLLPANKIGQSFTVYLKAEHCYLRRLIFVSMKKIQLVFLLGGLFFTTGAFCQEKWSLRQCVLYAIEHNISIKQSDIQQKISEVQYLQIRDSRIPTLSFGNSGGFQFGRNIDPVTNQFTNQQIGFVNSQVQSNVTLFNWFSLKNTIAANKLTAESNRALVEKVKNDVSLNVANAYLTALLTYEQMNIAEVTMLQTKEQLYNTRKRVNAGALPELNAAEIEAQYFNDSANFVAAQSNRQLNLLQLKAILNMDAATPFDIETPSADQIPVETFAELEPATVYDIATRTQPQQVANSLSLQAAQKTVLAARGAMMPTFSAFGSLQSSFSSANKQAKGTPVTTVNPTPLFINVAGSSYFVQSPSVVYNSYQTTSFFNQYNNNFRQSLGIGLQVPIFNGHQLRSNWETSKLNVKKVVLQMQADSQTLKQNIYQAYQSAVTGFVTFQGKKKSVESAEYAYELGKKRYDIGLLPTLDLLILSTNLQRAKIDVASAQFDYIFRMKVLEFYKGQGLKL